MPSKSAKRRQSSLSKFRSDVAKLKAKGLVSKHVDAKRQRATKYMQGQVEKYKDVLSGQSKVVHTPKRAQAKAYADKFRVKGKTVVVPAEKAERVRYNKKTGDITSTRRIAGKRVRKSFSSGHFEDVIKLPRNENKLYQITFGNGQVWTFDAVEDLVAFMHPYEHPDKKQKNYRKPWTNWGEYVSIVDIDE